MLESLRQGGDWLRAVLATLARKGLAFRAAEPERTRALIDALSPFPWYKGGQFLFDLMEWEDFLLDGPPPPVVPTAFDATALAKLSGALDRVKAHFDSAAPGPAAIVGAASVVIPEIDLPPLESSMYLYENVVLGIVLSALPSFVPR